MSSAGQVKAGRAFVEITADDSRLRNGLRRAEARLKAFGASVQAAGRSMMRFGMAGGFLFGAAIKAFADFDKNMRNVSTMLAQPERHIKTFTAEIRRMAVEYGESTETLSKGLYDILSAGIDAGHAIEFLETATRAARAGVTDTAVAVDGLTSVINAYQLSASEASHVSDLMFQTVLRGKLTFADLTANIGKVAPMARAAGMSMNDMFAAIATMTRQGLSAEEATTKLVNVIKLFPEQSKNILELVKSFEGLDLAEITKTVPNIRAAQGIAALSGDVRGLAKDIELMGDSGGAAEDAFAKLAGSASMTLGQIREAALEVLRSIGESLAGPIKDAVSSIMQGAAAVAKWIQQNQELVATIAKITLGVLAFGVAALIIGKVVALVGGLIGAVRALHVALAFLAAHPVIGAMSLLAAALTAVGVAGWVASEGIDAAVESTRSLFDAGQKQRKDDMAKLNRLGELAAKQNKTNAEINEAVKLNRDLESVYGDLGISIDKATGAIEGFADGMLRAVDAMHDMAAIQIGDAIDALNEKIDDLNGKVSGAGGFWNFIKGPLGDDARKINRELTELRKRRDELEKKQARIRGYAPGAVTETEEKTADTKKDAADAAAASAKDKLAEKAADEERKMLDELYATYISHIADEYERNVKSINQRYDIEERRIREQYAESDRLNEMLGLNKMRRDQELHYELMRRMRERAEAEKKAAEKLIEETTARRKRIEDARMRGLEGDEERMLTIRELNARLSGKRGLELQKELLKIEKERAQEAAIAAGQSLDLVDREFELRARLAEMQNAPGQQIVGSWGSRGIRALEGAARNVQEKIEKNTKKAADKLGDIARVQAARPAAAFV
jgi:hypothetical protein